MASKYQKRHYEDVASILKGALDEHEETSQRPIESMVWEFDALFTEDSPLYDSEHFLRACGLDDA